jgi:hypothetical protein
MHYLPRSSGIEELSSSQDRRGKKKLDQGSMVARLKGEEGSSLAHSDPVFSFFNMVFRNAGIRIGCLLLSSLVKAFLLDCIIPREDDVLPLIPPKEFHSISGGGIPHRDAATPLLLLSI